METTAETLDGIADGTLFEKLVGYADKMAECKLQEELEKQQLELTRQYMLKCVQLKLDYDIAKAILAPSPFTLYQDKYPVAGQARPAGRVFE